MKIIPAQKTDGIRADEAANVRVIVRVGIAVKVLPLKAQALGLNRNTLRKKLLEHGLIE